jgi:hypothetical protein
MDNDVLIKTCFQKVSCDGELVTVCYEQSFPQSYFDELMEEERYRRKMIAVAKKTEDFYCFSNSNVPRCIQNLVDQELIEKER